MHVYVGACVCGGVHTCMYGGLRSLSGIFLHQSLLFWFVLAWFEQGLPLNLVLTKISELAASEPQVLPAS